MLIDRFSKFSSVPFENIYHRKKHDHCHLRPAQCGPFLSASGLRTGRDQYIAILSMTGGPRLNYFSSERFESLVASFDKQGELSTCST